jgi:hypothetical protein
MIKISLNKLQEIHTCLDDPYCNVEDDEDAEREFKNNAKAVQSVMNMIGGLAVRGKCPDMASWK